MLSAFFDPGSFLVCAYCYSSFSICSLRNLRWCSSFVHCVPLQ